MESKPGEEIEAKFDASIDIASFGCLAISTLTQTFYNLLASTSYEGLQKKFRTKLEQQERDMRMVYSQLRWNHLLLQMIEGCLDSPENRPSIREVLHQLEEARAELSDKHTDTNKLELLQVHQTQPSNQVSDLSYSERVLQVDLCFVRRMLSLRDS